MEIVKKFQTPNCPLDDNNCQVPNCDFKSSSVKKLLSHYRSLHTSDPDFRSTCIYSKECLHVLPFRTPSNLNSHLHRYHPELFKEASSSIDAIIPNADSESDSNIVNISPIPDVDNKYEACELGAGPKVAAADFVLNMLGDNKFNQVQLKSVMDGGNSLVRDVVNQTLDSVNNLLSQSGCDHSVIIKDLKLENHMSMDFFHDFRDQYNQIKYFKQHHRLIMPQKIKLPSLPVNFGRTKVEQDQHFFTEDFVFVSLIDQLEQLLNIQEIYNMINYEATAKPGFFTSFADGNNFKNSPLFQRHPNALQVHLYLDEVQLCNPIGSYTHKIVFIYFSLGNIHPKYRSSYKSINLLAMFYHFQIASYDINTFLKPIVEQLQKLKLGHSFTIGGRSETIYGTSTAVIADNLASHQVGGFKLGFSKGYRKCRSCLALHEDIQTKFFDREFVARSQKDHDQHCKGLENKDLHDHNSWLYGINQISILNSLLYFHVISGLVPDIMHDILEGVLPLTLAKFILSCIEKKYFSLKQLNHIIKNFDYGHSEIVDKPSPITTENLKKEIIRGSASQKWLLAVNFLLMMGKKINKEDSCLNCFSLLLQICRLVFKKDISDFELLNLELLIAEFLSEFKECWPSRQLIPKMHHLVHYPRYIKEIGPLGAVWCMRYEAKHAYFKSLQRAIGNWINVPWTLSYRHQQWMCQKIKSHSPNNFFCLETKVSKQSTMLSLTHLRYYGGQIGCLLGFNSCLKFVKSYPWVSVGSLKFVVNKSVILFKLFGEKFHFGLIVDIVRHEGKILFICRVLMVHQFDSHFQAFQVAERKDFFHAVVPLSHIMEFRSFSLHIPGFIKPKQLLRTRYIITKTDLASYFVPLNSKSCSCKYVS